MNARKSRDDHQAKRSGQAGRLGLKSKKRVRIQTDEQRVENNEEEDDQREQLAGKRRAYDEAVAEEQREHEDGIRRESRNTGGSSGSDEQRRKDEEAAEAEEEELEEGRVPNAMTVPEGPSHQEREEHNLTHIPFRDWCEHCVRARARRRAHRRRKKEIKKEELQRVTRIYMDFYTMVSEKRRSEKKQRGCAMKRKREKETVLA